MIAMSGIHLVSNYDSQYEKDQSHQMTKLQGMIVVYITVTIYYFFNGFCFMFFCFCFFCFEFQGFYVIFLQIFPVISTKSSKVYFMFLISVFAIFNIDNLNLCQRNFDVNKNHFNCKTFTTEILDINRIRYNYGGMVKWLYGYNYQQTRLFALRRSSF